MAEQRAGRAEQAQRDAHDTVGQVEAQLALLTRQLHQAREDHHGLQDHFEVRTCLPAAFSVHSVVLTCWMYARTCLKQSVETN